MGEGTSVLPWVIAAATVAISLVVVLRDIRWRSAEKLQAIAEVIGVNESTDSDGHTTYGAKYRFRTEEGRTIETGELAQRRSPPTIGSTVPLWYDRARPETIHYSNRAMGVGLYVFLALFDAAMLGFAWFSERLS